jgi:2,3-bisphosphoglycerate-dependent phosphoglycerate mutase
MRIYLVRHGQSNANIDWSENTRRADMAIELSPVGHEQAKGVGKFLAQHFLSQYAIRPKIRLWHSPYMRTRQTAKHIYEECQTARFGDSWFLDMKEHFLLYEQQHGIYDGLTDEERARDFPGEWAYYQKHKADGGKVFAQIPLGESRMDVAQRIHQAFGTFHRDADRHEIKDIVVVGHGTTNRCFAFAWLHLPYEWLEAEPNPLNGSVRLIEDGKDLGYIFEGFPGR